MDYRNLYCCGSQDGMCHIFSDFLSIPLSLNGILSILSCSFRLFVGLGIMCAVIRSTVNLQLCSSE